MQLSVGPVFFAMKRGKVNLYVERERAHEKWVSGKNNGRRRRRRPPRLSVAPRLTFVGCCCGRLQFVGEKEASGGGT